MERLRGGKGYLAWRDEQIAAFREKVSDLVVKFGFELALATGQRPSDVIGLNWSDYDGEGITLIPNKTGRNRQENELYIPLKQDVVSLIESRKALRKSTRMLENEQGRPLGYHAFEYRLRQARKAAGIEGVSMHGLRKNAVRELLEAGCSDAEVMAITGHRSREMVTLYGRGARQKRVAISAIKKRTSNG